MTKQIDWWAIQLSQVLRSLRHYLHVQSQGHQTTDHLEERGMERGSTRRPSLSERMKEGHRQSDKYWNHFKGNLGETSDRVGFFECIDTT